MPWRKFFRRFLSLVFLLSLSLSASAQKLDIMTGGYSLSATTSTGEGSKSGPGLYRIGYLMSILDKLELGLGYTVISSQVVGGDLAFGFDINGYYFPFSKNRATFLGSDRSRLFLEDIWRPFVGLGFHQRQFQSVSTNFAGFSLSFGTERAFQENLSFKAEGRYITFNGPSDSTATEIGMTFGVSLTF